MNIPIFSKFIKARDKPSNTYTGNDLTYLFGQTTVSYTHLRAHET